MTEHPGEGTLLSHLDGELSGEERARLRRHLEACGHCRSRLEGLRRAARTFSRAVARLDRRPPPADVSAILERRRRAAGEGRPGDGPGSAGGGQAAPDGAATGPADDHAGPGWRAAWLKAAVLLLTVAGVAAALPGSPLRGWLERSLDRIGLTAEDDAPVAAAGRGEPEGRAGAGVSVPLREGHVMVRLTGAPAGTEVRVRLVPGDEAGVRAVGGRYRTAPGEVELEEPTGGAVSVRLPRSGTARVEVDGSPVLIKARDGLRVLAPSADTAGSEIRFSTGA